MRNHPPGVIRRGSVAGKSPSGGEPAWFRGRGSTPRADPAWFPGRTSGLQRICPSSNRLRPYNSIRARAPGLRRPDPPPLQDPITRASSLAALVSSFLVAAIGCGSVDTNIHESSQATSGTGAAGGAGGNGDATSSTASASSGTGGGCGLVDDGNACTDDACFNGVAVHTPTPPGKVCAPGGAVCDGMGNCPDCLSPTDCPGKDTDYQTRTCAKGQCGLASAAVGTPTPMQIVGDCQKLACDGNGGVVALPDGSDVPDDLNPCTVDVCSAGAPANVAKPQGTACGVNLVCDGKGDCVGCNAPADCPGVDDACHTRTCTAGQCGVIISPAPACALPVCLGTLGFAEGPPMPVGAATQSVSAADLNGDGKTDLVVANQNSNTVSVLLGTGTGTFAAKSDYAMSAPPSSLAVRDVNGDGRPDLAVTEGQSTVRVLLNVCFP